MIFPDYGEIRYFGFVCGIFFAAYFVFRSVRRTATLIRYPVRILAVFFGLFGLVMGWIPLGWVKETRSSPIYSPDHHRAIMITETNAGAAGGDTSVQLYSNYGLLSETIFTGDYGVVESKGISWVSNSEAVIKFWGEFPEGHNSCNQAHSVTVRCESVTWDVK